MSEFVHVKGLSELNALLQSLPVKIEKNILRGAVRAGAKIVLPTAQQNIHKVSGELAKGLKIGTRAKGNKVTGYIKTSGKHGYLGHFLEFAVKPHSIKAKGRGWLSFGGIFRRAIEHPGWAKGKHAFMRPALDQQASAATVAAGNYIKQRLASKQGLDTSYIMVEGDE